MQSLPAMEEEGRAKGDKEKKREVQCLQAWLAYMHFSLSYSCVKALDFI